MTLKIYKLVSPSDPITFEAPSDLVAGLTALSVGEGAYGVRGENDETVLPIFLLDRGDGILRWLSSHGTGIETEGDLMSLFEALLEVHTEAMARAMLSFLISEPEERQAIRDSLVDASVAVAHVKAFAADPELIYLEFVKRIAAYNNEHRSSANDICGHAHELGHAFLNRGKTVEA